MTAHSAECPSRPADVDFGTTANWSSVAADFNNDGWLDIWSGARSSAMSGDDSHALLINHGNWSFTNEAISSGLAPPGVGAPRLMGGQVGDYDNDGYLDVIMANGGPESGGTDNFFRNATTPETGLRFEDVSSLIDYPAPPDPLCQSPGVNPKYIWANQADLIDSGMMHTRRTSATRRLRRRRLRLRAAKATRRDHGPLQPSLSLPWPRDGVL